MTAKSDPQPPAHPIDPSPEGQPFALPPRHAGFNSDKLDDFIDVMGPAQARRWLTAFQADLAREFADAAPNDTSRSNIHHVCGRAGLIGFDGLHQACLDFLDTRSGQDAVVTAYLRVRQAAEHVRPEIERCCARLA